jgi:hypothetical protein
MFKNRTLVKNMKHVKWNLIPPVKAPRALLLVAKKDKPTLEKKNG